MTQPPPSRRGVVARGAEVARWRLRTVLAAVSACAVVAACYAPPLAAAEPVSLGGAHLGVPLNAPAPPVLTEADEVGYEWRRCSFYTTMVSADGAAHLWPLDDATGSAADVVGSSPGHYLGAHASAPGGPLVEQGDVGAAFDGSTSAVTLPGAAGPQGVGAYTYELWARPTEIDGVYRFLVS
ncbi:MAG TPA: hypothetical protein VNU24_06740, partial [Solirubrobacteraceae bacterium]|nr:hypothetical protein [Solirubrobacteraceae bacterium]